jgi:arylsulfatase A-like enzyme
MIALAMRGDLKAAQLSSRSPNIVFVLADDLGYADVSCYGRPDLSTPNIDRIAAKGVRFLQAYANSACAGNAHGANHWPLSVLPRVDQEEPVVRKSNVGWPPEHTTLPSLLKKVGYSTTLIGKWHLGVLPKFGPLQSGYDHFYGFRGGAVDYYSHSAGHKEDLWDDDVQSIKRVPHRYAGAARWTSLTTTQNPQPFLLSLHFNAPLAVGSRGRVDYRAWHSRERRNIRFDGGSEDLWRMIEAMDRQIGRVLQALT